MRGATNERGVDAGGGSGGSEGSSMREHAVHGDGTGIQGEQGGRDPAETEGSGGTGMNIRKEGDTDWIPVTRGALKKRIGRYVVYDYKWLLENIETEARVIEDSKRLRQMNYDKLDGLLIDELRKGLE